MVNTMKKKVKLLLITSLLALSTFGPIMTSTAHAEQPHTSYWHPATLLKWSPTADKDAKFNRGTIPLAERFTGQKVNPNAQAQSRLVALSALNDHTSGVPSQGSSQFRADTFGYWQYVDMMVLWGGSASEGLIVPPSADIIDASHKNGVPIIGTIFFPPNAYGGNYQWVQQMLQQKPDGSFPVADKLLEAASYFGFDGWFINQETSGGNTADAAKMQQFMQYLQTHKPSGMHIMWYDSMTNSGGISWQNELNARNQMFLQNGAQKVADSMFLNFNWSASMLQNSKNKANSLNRDPYDLYAGIDTEANGYNTYVNWSGIFPNNQDPATSLGIYRPDWTYRSSSNNDDFYAKELKYWVGPNSDPRNTANSSNWKGIANYFADKSAIQQLPFTTNFNTGHGSQFAVDGNVMSTKEWNNRSLQDILPTWRWIAESSGTALKPSFDWNNAYYGGSSLKVSGALSPQNATHLKLYRTNLPVSGDTEISVTYKSGQSASNMKVGVSFADNPEHFEFFDVGDGDAAVWNTKSISLGSFAGRTIDALSLKFDSGTALSNYAINIGQLSVRNANSSSAPGTVTGLAIEDVDFSGNTADARLSWDPSSGDKVQVYEVYRVKPDGVREFIGATPNTAYYAQPMSRLGGEESTTLEVVALGENGARSTAAQASFQWQQASTKMNLALNQTATADSFVPGETPAKAFDGTTANNSKWCATGSEPHWLQVDLGSVYSIDQFIIKHAQEGGESSNFNTKDFNIQLSEDGTNWADVVHVTGNTLGKTTHSIDRMSARYARLNVTKATQESDTAARIYEFEVWGQQLQ